MLTPFPRRFDRLEIGQNIEAVSVNGVVSQANGVRFISTGAN
jgi:hypothetical protein